MSKKKAQHGQIAWARGTEKPFRDLEGRIEVPMLRSLDRLPFEFTDVPNHSDRFPVGSKIGDAAQAYFERALLKAVTDGIIDRLPNGRPAVKIETGYDTIDFHFRVDGVDYHVDVKAPLTWTFQSHNKIKDIATGEAQYKELKRYSESPHHKAYYCYLQWNPQGKYWIPELFIPKIILARIKINDKDLITVDWKNGTRVRDNFGNRLKTHEDVDVFDETYNARQAAEEAARPAAEVGPIYEASGPSSSSSSSSSSLNTDQLSDFSTNPNKKRKTFGLTRGQKL